MPIAPSYLKPLAKPALPITAVSPQADIVHLQEWLVARGYDVGLNRSRPGGTAAAAGIDGDFGNLTATACRNFAFDSNMVPYKGVDEAFWFKLTSPMLAATSFRPKARAFGAAMVETAQAYLLQEPKEARLLRNGLLFGADNSGPWVDLFNHGAMDAWCLGAVDTIIDQVARALPAPPPLSTVLDSVRCLWVPRMVDEARARGLYLGGHAATPAAIKPGSVFFVRNSPGAAISHFHTGIVEAVKSNGRIVTIEGNTNNDGSSNGWLFIRRERDITPNDYAVIA